MIGIVDVGISVVLDMVVGCQIMRDLVLVLAMGILVSVILVMVQTCMVGLVDDADG